MLETVWESRWLPDLQRKQAKAFHIDSRLSAIKIPKRLDILMTDKQAKHPFPSQSIMYLENFTQRTIYQKKQMFPKNIIQTNR